MIDNALKPPTKDIFGPQHGGAKGHEERAGEEAKDAANSAIESGRHAVAEARNAMGTGVHMAQENLGSALDIAREAAANFANSASTAAAYVGQKAEDATSTVGDAIGNSVHYLKDDGLNRLASDGTDLIRRNPIPAMLLGIGLGFIISQASNRRSS